jgi:cytochrome c oxidase subunit 2
MFAAAPYVGWWLPPNVASFGGGVDWLYYLILGFTTFFFVLTEVILVYAMIRFVHTPGRKAQYVEGNTKLEMFWTFIPAALLLFIAFAQVSVWAHIKYQSQMPSTGDKPGEEKLNQVIQVTARQWEWRFRYPTKTIEKDDKLFVENYVPPDALNEQRIWAERMAPTDLHVVNEVHTWKDANVKLYLKTNDVIHSFFLPNLRFKQDALPGKTIPMWFRVTDFNVIKKGGKMVLEKDKEWELACAELCGGSHYRMRGLLYVHKTQEDYNAWLKEAMEAQRKASPERTLTPIALSSKQ